MKSIRSGFTLMEALVATSLFAFAAAGIVGVYTSVQKLNQKSANLQVVQQSARFLGEDVTRTIRNGRVDYARYGGVVPQPSTVNLYLLDSGNIPVHIFSAGSSLKITRGSQTADLLGSDVKVLDFRVYIWPQTNPFPGGTEQPTVGVYLDLESNLNARDKVRVPFQFAVATKEYPE